VMWSRYTRVSNW